MNASRERIPEANIATRGRAKRVDDPDEMERKRRASAAASAAGIFDDRTDLVLVIAADRRLLHASSGWSRFAGEEGAPSLGHPVREAMGKAQLASADWEEFESALAGAWQGSTTAVIPLTFDHAQLGRRRLEGRLYHPQDGTQNVVAVCA